MDEFVSKIKEQAEEALLHIYGRKPLPNANPILEVIGCLLEDGAGGVRSPVDTPLTTEQWLLWNQLVMDQLEEVLESMTKALKDEMPVMPSDPERMRTWAACLLLLTLEKMDMF